MNNSYLGCRDAAADRDGCNPGTRMGNICYRAVHTKSQWRKVNTHQSLSAAVTGKDGAAGLFARKVRINY